MDLKAKAMPVFFCKRLLPPLLNAVKWRVTVLSSPGLLTLSGVSLYISYSYQAFAETERLEGTESLASVCVAFGWSLGLAWLSYGLELLTGVLLLVAARLAKLQHAAVAYKPEKCQRQAEDGNC